MDTLDTLDTFEQLSLDPDLKRAVGELGFVKPSPIQAQTLPILLGDPTDFIGLAATGTGKTAAFALPLLERIDTSVKGVQALILCPTRELCLQVSGQVNLLGKYKGIQSLAIYGGSGYDEQLRGLRKGVPVVVGTPGRMIDHLNRGTLSLDKVKVVVLDEADEMISMGFREDMEKILSWVPEGQNNTWLFSATMSGPVRKVADTFLTKPKMVQVNRTEMLSSGVEQICYMVQEKNKPEVLCKLIDAAEDFYGVIFCQTKSLVANLTTYLQERGYKADALHGDMSQAARETAMLAFRQKRKTILVCTDVASRGLDVKDITHVVNYSLPRELDSYVHRIGRTARSGKTGIAMALVTPAHRYLLNKIEAMTKSRFILGTIPTRRDIALKKISRVLAQFTEIQNPERATVLLDQSWKDALAGMSAEEVASRFLSLMYPWVLVETERPPQMARPSEGSGATARPSRPARESRSARDERPPRQSEERPRRDNARHNARREDRPKRATFERDRSNRSDRIGRGDERSAGARGSDRGNRYDRGDRQHDTGDHKAKKQDFRKGPFAKFAKGNKRSGGDQPPRRRPL